METRIFRSVKSGSGVNVNYGVFDLSVRYFDMKSGTCLGGTQSKALKRWKMPKWVQLSGKQTERLLLQTTST